MQIQLHIHKYMDIHATVPITVSMIKHIQNSHLSEGVKNSYTL